MSYMKSNRDVTIHSTSGHCLVFEDGKPTYVPDNELVRRACIERGLVECEAPTTVEPKPKVEKKISPAIQRARAKANPTKSASTETSSSKVAAK